MTPSFPTRCSYDLKVKGWFVERLRIGSREGSRNYIHRIGLCFLLLHLLRLLLLFFLFTLSLVLFFKRIVRILEEPIDCSFKARESGHFRCTEIGRAHV